jgi:hypothetical protein
MLLKDSKTDWVVDQTRNQIFFPKETSKFKQRRSAKLEALHSTLDELYKEVLVYPNPSS